MSLECAAPRRRQLWLSGVILMGGVGVATAQACSPSAKQLPPERFLLPVDDGSTAPLTADVGVQPTRIVATSASGPEAGVLVVYQDVAGAVITFDHTDSLGRAARALPSGAQVTVLFGTTQNPAAITYVGVQPGDLLIAYDLPSSTATAFQGQITAYPPLTPALIDAGAQLYTVLHGFCSDYDNNGVPFNFNLLNPGSGCMNALGQFPMLVLARSFTADLAYTFQYGNTVAFDGGVASFALDGSWATTLGTWNVSVANAPASPTNLHVIFSEVANALPYSNSNQVYTVVDAGLPSTAFVTHPGYGDFVQTEVGYSASLYNYTAVATRSDSPSPSGSVTMDVAQFLPLITTVTTDFTNKAQPTITWSYTTGAGGSAGTVATFYWFESTDSGLTYPSWTFVVPPGTTSAKAPQLPSPQATAWIPTAASGINTPIVISTDTTTGFGVKEFRELGAALQFGNNPNAGYQPFVPPLPANGTVRLTSYGPAGG